jgi:choline dehydrogenase-like flavoprotein
VNLPGDRRPLEIITALVHALASEPCEDGRLRSAPSYEEIAHFIHRQQHRMSSQLRVPLNLLTRGFDWTGFMREGRNFSQQSRDSKRRQLDGWRKSPIGFKRDFVRFYESLVLLALNSGPSPTTTGLPPAPATEGGILESPGNEISCEVAVIGSGPGGSISACLLAEAGRDTLLVEEGEFRALESCPPFSLTEMEQKYRNGGLTVALGRTKIAYAEARCVGGGSEINSGLYHRTPTDILDSWRSEFEVEALSEPDLRPHFEACERDVSVSPLAGEAPIASQRLCKGAALLGWEALEIPRWIRYDEGEKGIPPRGMRQSMTKTFIPRFLAAGGRLLPRTRVASLRREGRRWLLQSTDALGGARRISAETVFVCAGAIHSAALLRRSGITKNIGDSLRMHPTAKVVARFPDVVNTAGMGVPVHQVKEFSPRLSFGCSISTPPHLALGLLDHPEASSHVRADWPNLATYYAMITGQGHGRVRTLPGFADPLVSYRLTPNDLFDLGDGLRKLSEMLFASGASALYPAFSRARPLRSRQDVDQLAGSFPRGGSGLMTIHLFSSCPMGERRDRCAVDSFGQVHDVPNLRLADASILCGPPGVNPQGTIMALSRRNTLHFLGEP